MLMLDANQSYAECLDDRQTILLGMASIAMENRWSFHSTNEKTTKLYYSYPQQGIDYVLTYGIHVVNLTTMVPNFPALSDHLGIVFNLDLGSYFSSTFSDISSPAPRLLTSGNLGSTKSYIKYVTEQITIHKLVECMENLFANATSPTHTFSSDNVIHLNKLDSQLTEIMLSAERLCSRRSIQRHLWSPQRGKIARTFLYWKQKANMSTTKLFYWHHLDQLWHSTDISEKDHAITDPDLINTFKKEARAKWQSCKKKKWQYEKKVSLERVAFLASKMCTTEEKALKAILKSEESRAILWENNKVFLLR